MVIFLHFQCGFRIGAETFCLHPHYLLFIFQQKTLAHSEKCEFKTLKAEIFSFIVTYFIYF